MFDPVWTALEISQSLGMPVQDFKACTGVQIDSRSIVPGDLFVALSGCETDGHNFVSNAFESGAHAAIVSRLPSDLEQSDERLIFVEDTGVALNRLAHAARARASARCIAVTGSAGKTSVVQALRAALARAGEAHSSIKSFNNHVGVPVSLARMHAQSEYGVFEVGMSAQGEIEPLAQLIKPDVCIITTIGAAHLKAFEDREAIAREKASIFKGMSAGGTAIIGMQHAYSDLLCTLAKAHDLKVIKVGFDDQCDVRPVKVYEQATCSCLSIGLADRLITFKVNQPGPEWILNAMMILTAVNAVKGDIAEAALSLASLVPEKGRGRLHELMFENGTVTLQDDSYNANPLSMRAALGRFARLTKETTQKSIAVLGDMAELGRNEEAEHLALVPYLKQTGFDLALTVGDYMPKASKEAGIETISCKNVAEISDVLQTKLSGNELIYVKGSNSTHLTRVVDDLIKLSRYEGHTTALGQGA
ncbi:UDP-N-acetylmuramoyl-tripeptide--D-alanyl-D-alanine ligase [Temperatibacter marinus]|uniref:UDP-N-acetylmuramoyl-tripeptide--D-alanyl-D-alanine ligase n=1 Tax=Temperatibacter marinus TaxID=1456591 RepID=A0AA52EBB6_9PROT|nr:UDP-N-acetylmuramoyl-tripeptide--D-alanyl-D-alanine ligase [Temperatibacter marinus]WND01590.1 UDP-N-acetylmuramoyl-tripeptide--D-alanyl-D-alanine ligase [Temperatibacter marinus]